MRWLVLLAALAASGCTVAAELRERQQVGRMRPTFTICPDGLPVQPLVDVRCPGGLCGFSCLPDRWNQKRPQHKTLQVAREE